MERFSRLSAATFALTAALGLAGLGAATDARAQPGPFPQWCPGDFWDPGWGDNWDWGNCHDNWRDRGPGDWRPGDRGPGDWGPGDWGPGDRGPGDRGPGGPGPGRH